MRRVLWLVLGVGVPVLTLNGLIASAYPEDSWRWTFIILGAGALLVALNEIVVNLYIRYARTPLDRLSFSRDDQRHDTQGLKRS